MHEPIFIAAVVYHILLLALRPWRLVEGCVLPYRGTPPPLAIRGPTRKAKGPREKYPAGFA